MPGKISRCNICGKFFDSKKELKKHKNKDHRITASKIVKGNPPPNTGKTIKQAANATTAAVKGHYQEEIG